MSVVQTAEEAVVRVITPSIKVHTTVKTWVCLFRDEAVEAAAGGGEGIV